MFGLRLFNYLPFIDTRMESLHLVTSPDADTMASLELCLIDTGVDTSFTNIVCAMRCAMSSLTVCIHDNAITSILDHINRFTTL